VEFLQKMRKCLEPQVSLGATPITEVELDLTCRHELVPILKALQHVYGHPRLRDELLELVRVDLVGERSQRKGAEGMTAWEVLVLAAVRLGCDLDYDALHDQANNHCALRQIRGVSGWEAALRFPRSTVHQNVSRLRPETLWRIAEALVQEGHQVKRRQPRRIRFDGFVVETNIHYPTDSSLLLDGLRVMLRLVSAVSAEAGIPGWRQQRHLLAKGKKLHRKIDKAARSRGKGREGRLRARYGELLEHVEGIASRCEATIQAVEQAGKPTDVLSQVLQKTMLEELRHDLALTARVCDQARRRVQDGETVPVEEKVFSLFEPHTQLVNRGKRPDPIEFGRLLVVAEDELGFVVGYRILAAGELEQDVAVPMVTKLQERWEGSIESVSFDRGFYTAENLEALTGTVKVVALPTKKRKLSQADLARESSEEFQAARKRHPGIESKINALEAGNGLDRCRDRGEHGFQRYLAQAVLGRNLHTLGRLLLEREQRRRNRDEGQRALAA
jgi:hypothetical protein